MSTVPQDFGVTDLGDVTNESILSNIAWDPKNRFVTVAGSQGVLKAGTLLMDNGGKAYEWDGSYDVIGYLNEAVDTTDGDVLSSVYFDAEINKAALFAATIINTGFYPDSLLNIKEAL